MDVNTLEVVSVYHKFAFSHGDTWCRRNIHGLNLDFLHRFGFANEDELLNDFKLWTHNKNIKMVYENGISLSTLKVFKSCQNLPLSNWTVRIHEDYHKLAYKLKMLESEIHGVNCTAHVHSMFRPYGRIKNNFPPKDSVLAKESHGYHCALYDAYELVLFYLQCKRVLE